MEELDLYTGKLTYKGIEFSFVFDKEELRLIPPTDKRDEVRYTILMKEIRPGVYTMASPSMDEPYLIGKCNETGQTVVFLTKHGAHIGSYNAVLFVEIAAYILCKTDTQPISKMAFICSELDCIHPVTQGFSYTYDHEQFHSHGILSVQTEDFDATTTEPQLFQVDGKDVSVSFGIARSFSTKIGQPPLTLRSTMSFRFAPTEDYSFIVRLWFVAKEFLQFMCYRKNVFLPTADLSTPADEGNTRTFATFNMLGETGEEDPETLQKGRYIKLAYLSGAEGRIMSDIASRVLYTRHIPDTYVLGCRINAARFVMITAAFEWEFKRLYQNGITKSEETLAIEATATEEIQKLIDKSTGDLKRKYKFLRKLISSNSLQSEVVHVGNELGEIIDLFGKRLYSMNDTDLLYSEMGKRLADQRNNYAHGNLDIDFIDKSLIDLIYTERIVYAMQLKLYGVETKNIQNAINDLFRCGMLIR